MNTSNKMERIIKLIMSFLSKILNHHFRKATHKVRISRWEGGILCHQEYVFDNLKKALAFVDKLEICEGDIVKVYDDLDRLIFAIDPPRKHKHCKCKKHKDHHHHCKCHHCHCRCNDDYDDCS